MLNHTHTHRKHDCKVYTVKQYLETVQCNLPANLPRLWMLNHTHKHRKHDCTVYTVNTTVFLSPILSWTTTPIKNDVRWEVDRNKNREICFINNFDFHFPEKGYMTYISLISNKFVSPEYYTTVRKLNFNMTLCRIKEFSCQLLREWNFWFPYPDHSIILHT